MSLSSIPQSDGTRKITIDFPYSSIANKAIAKKEVETFKARFPDGEIIDEPEHNHFLYVRYVRS